MPECSACHREVADGARFCSACGTATNPDPMATRTVAVNPPSSRRPSSSQSTTRSSGPRTSRDGRFSPGDVLAGRYRIVAMLGRGGMGEVYRADDLSLDQQVALKFLPESLTNSESAIERFRNEVRLARQVAHANVCRVYDLGEIDGIYFLSMEYVDGEDLGSLIRRIGRLPADKALDIARKLCAGLSAAHQRGVLHRDLKPANIMLDSQGQVRLTDFGLAGMSGSIVGDEVRSGTPAYMAPEQIAGEEVTERSDIYSLGLVLYEVFTGKLPFESDTVAGLIKARTETAPEHPSAYAKDMDPLVERAILRCLTPRPADRPASALAVAAALPGGNALEAALAAGEMPSLQMVAAAGEGLKPAAAWTLAGIIALSTAVSVALLTRSSALDLLNPQYSADVLTQKARDIIQKAGGDNQPADHAEGFEWENGFRRYAQANDKPRADWKRIATQRPALLTFWYRQAASPLVGVTFHSDLLIPGVVQEDDPPPTESRMTRVRLDYQGRLLYFERMPSQVQSPLKNTPPAVDWAPLFTGAAIDQSKLESTEPLWTFLAASDARVAWKGSWPDSDRPLRIEAASMRGRPVAFSLIGPWTPHERAVEGAPTGSALASFLILAALVLAVCIGGALMARKNIKSKRVDLPGAMRLGAFIFWIQMALWLLRGHINMSQGTFAMFIIAVCTAVFAAAVAWTLYVALEPYVRRRWPQILIGWSALLTGRIREAVVGRDVLIGVALGTGLVAIDAIVSSLFGGWGEGPELPSTEPVLGLRGALAHIVAQAPSDVRNALLFLFVIYLLRALTRNQWIACGLFALLFGSLSLNQPLVGIIEGYVISVLLAVAMVRWGVLASATLMCFANTLGNAPFTSHSSAWFWPGLALSVAVPLIAAIWAFRVATSGHKLWSANLLE
jgi:serine/threonine-protein kinase